MWYVNSFSWPEKTSSYHNLIISLGSINGQAKSIWPCMRLSWINPGWKKVIFMGFYATKCPTPFIFFDPHLQLFSLRLDLFFHKGELMHPLLCVCPTQMFQRYILTLQSFLKRYQISKNTYCIFSSLDAVYIMCGSKFYEIKSILYIFRKTIFTTIITCISSRLFIFFTQ